MSEPNMTALMQRLDRLERANRVAKRVGFVLVVGLAAVGLMGQVWPRAKVLEAEQLVIRDAGGRTRVMIGRGVPRVPGQPAELAKLAKPEFGLFVYAEDSKQLVNLTAAGNSTGGGNASLTLLSPDEKAVALLSLSRSERGSGSVGFSLASQLDPKRAGAAAEMLVWDDGTPTGGPFSKLVVGSARGVATVPGATLDWRREGNSPSHSRLSLFDEARTERATLGHTTLEASRTGSIEERSESSLVLFSRDGKVLWSAP